MVEIFLFDAFILDVFNCYTNLAGSYFYVALTGVTNKETTLCVSFSYDIGIFYKNQCICYRSFVIIDNTGILSRFQRFTSRSCCGIFILKTFDFFCGFFVSFSRCLEKPFHRIGHAFFSTGTILTTETQIILRIHIVLFGRLGKPFHRFFI